MMMVIPKGYETSAADATPGAEAVAKMMEYNKNSSGTHYKVDGLRACELGARVLHQ
jgi:hypothetical protein